MSRRKKQNMNNGFEEHKNDMLNRLKELKKGQDKHTDKIEELRLQVVKSFGEMETKLAVIKTKVVFITAALSIVLTTAINIVIKVF